MKNSMGRKIKKEYGHTEKNNMAYFQPIKNHLIEFSTLNVNLDITQIPLVLVKSK